MSRPAASTIERERHKLWVTDSELIRLLGAPEKLARRMLQELDSKPSGFPKKSKQWGDRRYMPAVMAYFERHHGGTFGAPATRGERK